VLELLLLVYATAVGFVAAGLAASLFQLVTSRPVAFVLPSTRLVSCFVAGLSFALVGPYIVARAAVRARWSDRKPLTWLAGGLALALLWSTCSGIVVLDLALSVRHSL